MDTMPDYDSDESNVEFLIQHMPLADVLDFVQARDEVRRIPAPLLARDENDDMLAPPSRQTMPAAVGRVVSAVIEVEAVGEHRKARLDADRTAEPLVEIVGVFPAGKKNFYANAEALIVRQKGRAANR